MRSLILAITFSILVSPAMAQTGIGLRFASNLNFFPKAKEFQLVENSFTTGILGLFLSSYKTKSGFELGLSVNYKNGDDKGFPNLPVVMKDFGENQMVGITGLEMDLKVGPRFGAINPKIGYVLGYRFQQMGFQIDGVNEELNPFYLSLPFGASINLPTNYGSVGFGSFFNVGIFNVLKNPNPGNGSIYTGGRMHFVNFEITVTYDTRD